MATKSTAAGKRSLCKQAFRSPVLLPAEAKEKTKMSKEILGTRDFSKPFSKYVKMITSLFINTSG